MEINTRSIQLLGEERFAKLSAAKVAVLGLGGVGGAAVEALARSGIGTLFICDYDTVAPSNFNRQLIADRTTLGKSKVEMWTERLNNIRPDLELRTLTEKLSPDKLEDLDLASYDIVLDCLDTVSVKIALGVAAESQGFKLISSGGMAKRQDPSALRLGDIYETCYDPLFKIMRRGLRRAGVKSLEVIYSTESVDPEIQERSAGGLPSMIFVPMTAGLRLAYRAIELLT